MPCTLCKLNTRPWHMPGWLLPSGRSGALRSSRRLEAGRAREVDSGLVEPAAEEEALHDGVLRRPRLARDRLLRQEARGREHGEAAVRELALLHQAELGGVLGREAERGEAEVAGVEALLDEEAGGGQHADAAVGQLGLTPAVDLLLGDALEEVGRVELAGRRNGAREAVAEVGGGLVDGDGLDVGARRRRGERERELVGDGERRHGL